MDEGKTRPGKAELEINEGEMLCDECNGSGYIDPDHISGPFCPKCLGYGKVDWIEHIVGKPKPKHNMFDIKAGSPGSGTFVNEMIEKLANDLAEQIDKEIIETLIADATKPEKIGVLFDQYGNTLKKK